MAIPINIPKLGMTMSEANLVEWKAKEGEWVEKGSAILTIETEKVTWEVEAVSSGFVHILVEAGRKAAVGDVVGLLAETKEELEGLQKESPREVIPPEKEGVRIIYEEEAPPQASIRAGVETRVEVQEGKRGPISPAARKMAQEHGIDITHLKGSGPGGRIVLTDIEKAIEEQKKVGVSHPAGVSPDLYQGRRVKEAIVLKGMRKVIAERMYSSLSSSAQLTLFGEMDARELVRLRETFLSQEKRIGVRVTYTEILVFALAKALRDHPDINCSLIGNEIKVWEDINIGVAVALGKEGLIVPVVKHADEKSLVEISREVKILVDKAREGKLMPDEVTGGTFTLTSIGPVGVSYFQTPVINQPESAILATGPIVEKPVVRGGQIVIGSMMSYSLTIDHRVINGFGAEQFMARLRDLLGTPGLLLQ